MNYLQVCTNLACIIIIGYVIINLSLAPFCSKVSCLLKEKNLLQRKECEGTKKL